MTRRYDPVVIATILVATSLALSACGTSASPAARATGAVSGRVTAGPTCPVERAGHPCPPAPVSATVEVKDRGGHVVRSTHTDAKGGYAMRVPVGEYRVAARTTKPFPRCPTVSITVAADHTTRAPISCDTGIR